MKKLLPFSRLTVSEGLVGVGFLIMLIGCAGADSSLLFAAALIAIGAIFILLGRKDVEKRYGTHRAYDRD